MVAVAAMIALQLFGTILFYAKFDSVDFDYLVGKHVSSRPAQQDTYLFLSLFYGLGKLDCVLGVLVAIMAAFVVHDRGGVSSSHSSYSKGEGTVSSSGSEGDSSDSSISSESNIMILIACTAFAFSILWNILGVKSVRVESKPFLISWAVTSPVPIALTAWLVTTLLSLPPPPPRPSDSPGGAGSGGEGESQKQLFICLVEAAVLFLVARCAVLAVGYQVCLTYFGVEGRHSLSAVHGKHDTARLYSKAPHTAGGGGGGGGGGGQSYGYGSRGKGEGKGEGTASAADNITSMGRTSQQAYPSASEGVGTGWMQSQQAKAALLQSGLATPYNPTPSPANPTPSPAQFGSAPTDGRHQFGSSVNPTPSPAPDGRYK